MGELIMFKQILGKLEKRDQILIIRDGMYELVDKYTRKIYLTFSNAKPLQEKENLLLDYYLNLIAPRDKTKI